MIETLKQHVLSGGMINEEQAKELAAVPDKEALYEAAHQITRHFMGNKFDTCSIINAKSGNCSEDCKWCAQSGHYKTNVTLYPLLPAEECIRHATHNHKQGISRFALVTSGKKVSDKDMVKITETVRTLFPYTTLFRSEERRVGKECSEGSSGFGKYRTGCSGPD